MAIKDKYVEFKGVDGYIKASSNNAYNIPSKITVEAWIWIDPTVGAGKMGLVSNYDNSSGYGLMLEDRKLAFHVNEYKVVAGTALATQTWHHVAASYDGSVLKLYINGSQQTSTTTTTSALTMSYASSPSFYIGRGLDQSDSYYFKGRICEVRLWDVVRTSTQLTVDNDKSLDASIANLRARFALDDGSLTLANDMINGVNAAMLASVKPGSSAQTPTAPAAVDLQRPSAHIDTSAVLGAALDKLNRKSVMGLIKQLTTQLKTQADTIKTQGTTISGHTTDIKTNTDDIAELNTTVGTHTTNIAKLRTDLDGHLKDHDKKIEDYVDTAMQDLLKADVFNEAAQRLALLQKEIDIVRASALSLDENELASVKGAIASALDDEFLGKYMLDASVTVNGHAIKFGALLNKLARRIEVTRTDFTFNDTDIDGATYTLSDSTSVVFDATRTQVGNDITYTFTTPTASLQGLVATFYVKVTKVTSSDIVAGVTLHFDEYQPVYHSNLYYDIN